MSAPFQPGDVVVCIDDGPDPKSPCGIGPCGIQRGNVYRLARCVEHVHEWAGVRSWAVELSGVVADTTSGLLGAWRFRKIDDEVTEEFRETLASIKSAGKPKVRA